MRTDKVMLLTCEGETGRIAARYLAARFPSLAVSVESPVARFWRLGFSLHGVSANATESLELPWLVPNATRAKLQLGWSAPPHGKNFSRLHPSNFYYRRDEQFATLV
jgi:hypothetical protein